tara:strand:- start:290 stop:979 length:690 start_codon:yes stop_codon:yes gene_type:complete
MRVRHVIKLISKFFGIHSYLKNIESKIKLYFGFGHGHSLLLKVLKNNKELLIENSLCLEIGSSRDDVNDQGSSKILGKFFSKNKIYFLTIDADITNTNKLRKFSKENKFFNAECHKGEEFSKNFFREINFLYLDAFDIYVENHSKERMDFYNNVLGKEISNKNSAEMHFTVIKNLEKNFSKNCIIVFDDTFEKKRNEYTGKGELAVPYLLKNNFQIISKNNNSIALKKN